MCSGVVRTSAWSVEGLRFQSVWCCFRFQKFSTRLRVQVQIAVVFGTTQALNCALTFDSGVPTSAAQAFLPRAGLDAAPNFREAAVTEELEAQLVVLEFCDFAIVEFFFGAELLGSKMFSRTSEYS